MGGVLSSTSNPLTTSTTPTTTDQPNGTEAGRSGGGIFGRLFFGKKTSDPMIEIHGLSAGDHDSSSGVQTTAPGVVVLSCEDTNLDDDHGHDGQDNGQEGRVREGETRGGGGGGGERRDSGEVPGALQLISDSTIHSTTSGNEGERIGAHSIQGEEEEGEEEPPLVDDQDDQGPLLELKNQQEGGEESTSGPNLTTNGTTTNGHHHHQEERGAGGGEGDKQDPPPLRHKTTTTSCSGVRIIEGGPPEEQLLLLQSSPSSGPDQVNNYYLEGEESSPPPPFGALHYSLAPTDHHHQLQLVHFVPVQNSLQLLDPDGSMDGMPAPSSDSSASGLPLTSAGSRGSPATTPKRGRGRPAKKRQPDPLIVVSPAKVQRTSATPAPTLPHPDNYFRAGDERPFVCNFSNNGTSNHGNHGNNSPANNNCSWAFKQLFHLQRHVKTVHLSGKSAAPLGAQSPSPPVADSSSCHLTIEQPSLTPPQQQQQLLQVYSMTTSSSPSSSIPASNQQPQQQQQQLFNHQLHLHQ